MAQLRKIGGIYSQFTILDFMLVAINKILNLFIRLKSLVKIPDRLHCYAGLYLSLISPVLLQFISLLTCKQKKMTKNCEKGNVNYEYIILNNHKQCMWCSQLQHVV